MAGENNAAKNTVELGLVNSGRRMGEMPKKVPDMIKTCGACSFGPSFTETLKTARGTLNINVTCPARVSSSDTSPGPEAPLSAAAS